MARIACFESLCDSTVRLPADSPLASTLDAGWLYLRYDMDQLKRSARRDDPGRYAAQSSAAMGMWRYRDVLPNGRGDHPFVPVSLGEGWTPMIQSRRYRGLFIKDEGANPTGASNARDISMTVTMACHYGIAHLAMASAGSAAVALAAYAAAAGIAAHIFMPQDASSADYLETVMYGADVQRVNGLLSDCARLLHEHLKQQSGAKTSAEETWFDVASLKAAFGLEGEKTMGYELAEQLGWSYPEAVLYPESGGPSLLGIWKAFDEMEALGWIEKGSDGVLPRRPRMYAVQSSLTTPVDRISEKQRQLTQSMLRAPVTLSGGRSVPIDDRSIHESLLDWAQREGILLSREGAAAAAVYSQLLASGELHEADKVVLFSTGAAFRDIDLNAQAMGIRSAVARSRLPTSLPVGGIITPI